MRGVGLLLLLAALSLPAGCGETDDRQWMKVNERYTTDEFRRDYTECSKGGKLDDVCMRARGWVSVSGTKDLRTNPEANRRKGGY
jgi:hypothetical protein